MIIVDTCIFFIYVVDICYKYIRIEEISMRDRIKNVIYILTNQQYPGYVKIGYASDLIDRLNTLNTGALVGFQVYGVLETTEKNADIQVHNIIGLLNPLLRAKDLSGDKERSKEFFKIEASEAFELLKNIAAVFGFEDKVYRIVDNQREKVNHTYNEVIKVGVKIKTPSKPSSYAIYEADKDCLASSTKFVNYETFIYDLCNYCIKLYSLDLFKSVVLAKTSSYKQEGYFVIETVDDFYYIKISDGLYIRFAESNIDVYAITLANELCATFDKVAYSINY